MLKVERIENNGRILAIVLRSSSPDQVVEFITPNEFPLQLGVHKRKKNEVVEAHEHLQFKELKNLDVQEIIFVKKGKISVGIYHKKDLFTNIILNENDTILLNSGHSVKFLEDTEMFEVKQGPYRERSKEKEFLR